ncbi:MAG: cadherin-like domain-containing protein [Piscirickettsiaceae bacterium]|nr:cadherin-like domain-containing protein [Piscirickettsiaceae bacterium]
MAKKIGVVTELSGQVKATSPDGNVRILQLGDVVFSDDVISNAQGVFVVIELKEGKNITVDGFVDVALSEIDYSFFETISVEYQHDIKLDDTHHPINSKGNSRSDNNEGSDVASVKYLAPEVVPVKYFDSEGIKIKFDEDVEEFKLLQPQEELLLITTPQTTNLVLVPNGNGNATGDISVSEDGSLVNKTFSVTPENLSSLSIANTVILSTELAATSVTPIVINTDEGVITITGFNPSTGLVTYSYDPNGLSKDHSGGEVVDSIPLLAGYSGGSVISGDLTILVKDTVPIANADSATVTEDGVNTATGNVITGSGSATADTFPVSANVVGVAVGDTGVDLDGSGVNTILTGIYGTIIIDSTGNYTYTLNNADPDTESLATGDSPTDSFTYTIKDDDGDLSHTTVIVTINGFSDIIVNTAPVFGAGSYTFNYAENSASGAPLGTVSATDADLADTVNFSIKTNVDDGLGNDVYQINSTTGEISLTAAGAAAFTNDFELVTNAHAITVMATDGVNNTDVAVTLNETDVNEAPIIDLDNNNSTATGADHVTSYALGQQGISIGDIDTIVSDVDSAIQSATITLTNFQTGDVLFAEALPSGISVSTYNSTTGVITLTGSASPAAYSEAIKAIKFYNGTGSDTSTRRIEVTVNDGVLDSNTATASILVATNNLSVSTQPVIEEGQSAIYRIELADARASDTKVLLTISGDATADDDYFDLGDISRDVQYESAPGVWTDVLFDGINYYVTILAGVNSINGGTFIDVKVKTKSDAVSDDGETLVLNAAIDVANSGDLTAMANTNASASAIITELPMLFVSAPTTITEGSDAIFEVGLSRDKATSTDVQLSLGGEVSSADYNQASYSYSIDDGTTWVMVNADVNGAIITISADANVARSVLVKINTLTDAIIESSETISLTATTSDIGVSPEGNSASDDSAIIDPIILTVNEEKDGVDNGGVTTVADSDFNYIKVAEGAHGSVTDNGDGTLTYKANTDYSGSDTFTFIKVDKVTGETFTATAQVNITAIADTPDITLSVNNKTVGGLPEVITDGSFSLTGTWQNLTGPGASGNYSTYDPADNFSPTVGEASFPKSEAIVQLISTTLNAGDSYSLSFDTNLTVAAADLTVRFVYINPATNDIVEMTGVGDIYIYNDVIIATGLHTETVLVTIPDTVGDGTGFTANAIVFENTDNGDGMIIDNISLKGDTTFTYDVNIDFNIADADNAGVQNEFIQDTVTITGVPTGASFSNQTGTVGTNNGAGSWSFTQSELTGLKISVAPSSATTGFTLVAGVTAEEGATTASNTASVTLIDTNDVPLIGDNSLIMANETGFVGTLTDTIETYFSTDGGNTFSWDTAKSSLPEIYADGELVTLSFTTLDTTADTFHDKGILTGSTVSGGDIFTVEITMGDGSTGSDVVYTQLTELLGIKETFDGGIILPGGGNNDSIVLGFNDGSGNPSGVNAIVTAHNLIEDTAAEIASPTAEHTVNTNNFYIGVNSNNMNAGQQLIFDFDTVASDGSGNTTASNDVVEIEISLFNFGSEKSGDELYITVLTGTDIATATRETIILTGDPDIVEEHFTVTSSTGGAFIGVEFLAGNESSFKLGIESISSVEYNSDFDMSLAYNITDADGDSDSGSIVISLDGDETVIYDPTKTYINAGDEQASSGAGDDVLVFNTGDSIGFSLDMPEILNFEVFDLTNDADTGLVGDHSLTSLTMQDILDMTDSGNVLKVFGDSGDTVSLLNEGGNTWTNSGQVIENTVTFDVYTSGLATLKVEDAINDAIF